MATHTYILRTVYFYVLDASGTVAIFLVVGYSTSLSYSSPDVSVYLNSDVFFHNLLVLLVVVTTITHRKSLAIKMQGTNPSREGGEEPAITMRRRIEVATVGGREKNGEYKEWDGKRHTYTLRTTLRAFQYKVFPRKQYSKYMHVHICSKYMHVHICMYGIWYKGIVLVPPGVIQLVPPFCV